MLDFYAGVGLFSSVLAGSFAQVAAVESSPTWRADLRYNSPPNVKVVRALTEQYLGIAGRRLQPDLVVVDPPRNGLGGRVLDATPLAEITSSYLCFLRPSHARPRSGRFA